MTMKTLGEKQKAIRPQEAAILDEGAVFAFLDDWDEQIREYKVAQRTLPDEKRTVFTADVRRALVAYEIVARNAVRPITVPIEADDATLRALLLEARKLLLQRIRHDCWGDPMSAWDSEAEEYITKLRKAGIV